jgi:sugar phosphate isomerase/epimerase
MIANLGLAAAYCGTTAHQAEVFGQVGADLRATYDVGNYMMAGEDPIAALDRVAPRLAHVHFKDWRIFPPGAEVEGAFEAIDGRQFLAVVLGTGVVDLPAALARLRQLDYGGSITVEYEGPDDPREAVAGSVAYMRRLLEAPT